VVADGHGGKEASAHVSSAILGRIVAAARDGSAESLNEAVVATFKALHEEVIELGVSSGTTCTVCCINASRGIISSWNVGDSFSLLVHDNGYMELGTSHRLDDSDSECERVRASGGIISRITNFAGAPVGPLRAFPGGLAVVRCIGDADCRQYVSPVPAFQWYACPPRGGALVACSDGVWDNLTAEEACRCLLTAAYDSATSAAAALVKVAIAKRGRPTDDTTAVVVLFGSAPVAPAASPLSPIAELSGKQVSFMRRRISNEEVEPDPNGMTVKTAAWNRRISNEEVEPDRAPAKQDFDPIDPLGAEDTDMSSMLSGALTVKKDTGDWDTSKVTTTPGKGVLKALFPGLGSSRSSSSASTSRSTSPVPSSRRSRSFGLSSPRALVSSTLGGLGKARSKSSLDLESLPWHGHGIPLGTSLNSAPGDGWCPEARS